MDEAMLQKLMKMMGKGGSSGLPNNETTSRYELARADEEVSIGKEGSCTVCSLKATLRCNGCFDAPYLSDCNQSISGTWYCSKQCQAQHWPEHKTDCKKLQQRIQVMKVGAFLRDVWLIFRTSAWDNDIKTVEVRKKQIRLLAGDGVEQMRARFIGSFPKSLIGDKRAREAVLTWRTCDEACMWLRPLLGEALHGRYKSIELMRCRVRQQKMFVAMVDDWGEVLQDNTNVYHKVWRVTTSSGEKWIVDPTSSQYAWSEPTMSWNQWKKERYETAMVDPLEFTDVDEMIHTALLDDLFDLFTYYQIYELRAASLRFFTGLLPATIHKSPEGIVVDKPYSPLRAMFYGGARQQRAEMVQDLISSLAKNWPKLLETLYVGGRYSDRLELLKDWARVNGRLFSSVTELQAFETRELDRMTRRAALQAKLLETSNPQRDMLKRMQQEIDLGEEASKDDSTSADGRAHLSGSNDEDD